jgi:hypothetical protein
MSDAIEAPATVDPTIQQLIDRTTEITRILKALGKPGNQDPYLRMLAAWEEVDQLRSLIQECEVDMRLRLFAGAFPNPKEGTNSHKLPDGRVLKGQYKINRYINEEVLPATLLALRERGVANTDALVRYKPELAKREWNSLSEENKLIFSPAITAKPGTPSFEITIPKRGR